MRSFCRGQTVYLRADSTAWTVMDIVQPKGDVIIKRPGIPPETYPAAALEHAEERKARLQAVQDEIIRKHQGRMRRGGSFVRARRGGGGRE
jgi:hypothetical protein